MNNLIKKILGSVIAIIPVVLIISGILFGFNILSILQFFLLPGIVILTLFNLYLFFKVDGREQSNGQQKKENKKNNSSNDQTVSTKKQDEQKGNKEQGNKEQEKKKEQSKEAEESNEQDSNEKTQNNEKKDNKDVTIEQNQNEGEQAEEEQNEEEQSQDEKTSATEKMIKVIKPKKLESYFQSPKKDQNSQEEQLEKQDSSETKTNSNHENKNDAELLEKAKELGPKGWSAITMGATGLISMIVKIIKRKRKNKN